MMRVFAATLAFVSVFALAVPESAAQIDLTGSWNVCLTCGGICTGGPYGYVTDLDIVQSGTAITFTLSGTGTPASGTIDPATGAFSASGIVFGQVTGTGSDVAISGQFDIDHVLFTGLRACSPSMPAQCDDGDPLTTDTCCDVPLGTCVTPPSGGATSCQHVDPPVCGPTTSTTTSSTTTTSTTTSTTSTTLVDRPVGGVKLILRRASSGREQLVFVSKDPNVAFPPIGSADDPATGTPTGMVIEVLSANEGTAEMTAPGGIGTPGWRVHDGAIDSYRFSNKAAPGGISVVRSVTLKQSGVLEVTANEVGLALAVPQGAVAIRITTGSYRSCALFDGIASTVDVPGLFKARRAVPTSLPDCDTFPW